MALRTRSAHDLSMENPLDSPLVYPGWYFVEVHNYWILATAAVVSVTANGQINTLTPQEKSAGWMLLFDGQSMKNWVDPRQKTPPGGAWTIEDHCLMSMPHPAIEEDLFSTQTYRDFELAFDWRIGRGGNSGPGAGRPLPEAETRVTHGECSFRSNRLFPLDGITPCGAVAGTLQR